MLWDIGWQQVSIPPDNEEVNPLTKLHDGSVPIEDKWVYNMSAALYQTYNDPLKSTLQFSWQEEPCLSL